MRISVGIEISDLGFMAAVKRGDNAPELLRPQGQTSWPAFVAWNGHGFVLGREAEQRSRLQPRWTSHTFWEHLSLSPSELSGLPRTPVQSELAYLFLKAFWEALLADGLAPDAVALALPGQFLPPQDADNLRIGLILGMARDLKWPLAALGGLSTTALFDQGWPQPAPPSLLYLDIHLHSAAMTLLQIDPDGTLSRRQHVRLPRLGYVPMMQSLTRAMGNRFLRATAFDVTSLRPIDQAFYDQTRHQLLEAETNTDCRYSFEANGRIHQAAFPREVLLRDLRPLEEGWADAAAKFLRDAQVDPSEVLTVFSNRTRILPALADAFEAHGLRRVLRLPPGAAARGAATLAAERPVSTDLGSVPIVHRVPARTQLEPHLEVVHLRSESTAASPAPTHLVVDGLAYPLTSLPEMLHAQPNGVPSPIPALRRLGTLDLRLHRDGPRWSLTPSDSPTGAIPLATGDRIHLRARGQQVELLLAAECQPGQT